LWGNYTQAFEKKSPVRWGRTGNLENKDQFGLTGKGQTATGKVSQGRGTARGNLRKLKGDDGTGQKHDHMA